MNKGTVKFFNEAKGYGFITPDDGSKDVFVHQKGLARNTTIQQDDIVIYDTEQGKKGLQAINVSLEIFH